MAVFLYADGAHHKKPTAPPTQDALSSLYGSQVRVSGELTKYNMGSTWLFIIFIFFLN